MAAPPSSSDASGTPGRVLGHHLPGSRITWQGWLLMALVFALPITLAGALLDAALQWWLGRCLGLWCWFT